MADFTDQDKQLLDKLRKGFEKEGKTRLELEPWEEILRRDETVNASRAALAAKIVEGFSGSWAAQYHFGWGSEVRTGLDVATLVPLAEPDPEGPPVPIRAKTSKLGVRGVPEINFVPYNWRTNTMGGKGPSLVGHPISFEVVGPTLKSPYTDWTWNVTQAGGANGGDLLTPSVRPDGGVSPIVGLIRDMYGPGVGTTWTIGDAGEPNGGLYLLVSDDGVNAGSLDAGQIPMGALPNFVDTARYELFRISEIADFTIEVHPNKPLSLFFDLPTGMTRNIRGITIVRPYVTRLQAIPQSGAAGGNDGTSTSGREQTFVVLSPPRAAGSDNFPPYVGAGGPGVGDGSWLGGGFTESRAPGSGIASGSTIAGVYGGAVRLPIPIPVLDATGNVFQAAAALPPDAVGEWQISTPPIPFTAPPFSPTNLPIVRVSATNRNADFPPLVFGSIPSSMGWFDVKDTTGTGILVSRVPETDPNTGLTYWGPGPYVSSVAGTPSVGVGMTLHEAVENIWLSSFYSADKVEASRMRNIIDPIWSERFRKQLSDVGAAPPPPGSSGGRPDKAIFATEISTPGGLPEAANPGNLQDLGFRMVLFPAKEDPNDATQAIPDFDRPIYGRELVIDGSVAEKQWVDVDYSSGIVRLSHPPPTSRSGVPDEPSDVIPNGIQGVSGNNPRGEVVLWAACVPYSMEPSQIGTGTRITTQTGDQRALDVASGQVQANIDQSNTTFSAVAPYFGVSGLTGAVDIVLDRLWDGPETGVITINSGNNDSPAFGRWGYTEKKTVLTAAGFRTALGLLSSTPTSADPTPAAVTDPRTCLLRREVIFAAQSLDVAAFSDFYSNDTTYGSSLRAETLRFKYAQTSFNMDGSVTVDPRTPGYMWNQQGAWMSAGIYEAATGGRRISDTGVLGGVYYQDSADATPTDSPSSGAVGQNDAGQFTTWSSSGVGAYNGVVSRNSRILLRHNLRLVFQFHLDADATPTVNFFVGLIGPRSATGVGDVPLTSLVFNAAVSPPSPGFSYLGVRWDGPFPGTPATFYAQNVATPGSAQTITTSLPWSNFQNAPHYLVIETSPYYDLGLPPGTAPGRGDFVKMALFDAQFNEVARTRFKDQAAVPYDTLMEAVVAGWSGAGGGVMAMTLYNGVLVNRTELPFLAIP